MRLIDADAAIEKLQEYITEMESDIYYGSNLGVPEDCICEAIEEVPTIEAEPVKHGKWKKIQNFAQCSECKHEVNWGSKDFLSPYCPNCGAKMETDGGDDKT